MKDIAVSIRFFLFWTLLLGVVYPLFCTGVAQIFFTKQAGGGILSRGGQIIGAELIGQKFESDKYFWGRPSAVDYNPLPSGGSNAGPTSDAFKKSTLERAAKLKASNPGMGEPPQDLVFASASGLDPHVSPEAASYQAPRIAGERALPLAVVQALIADATLGRQWGLFGEPRVNVLLLNLALDAKQGISTAPSSDPVR
jgi:K+-transporting ATPase ATPase C chain